MGTVAFTKMHGLGNNYIYINTFEETLPETKLSELAINVSNIYTGIGSDGMILICPSEKAQVKMRIFNNDGSEAKNCGNGLRCVAKYAYENKLVTNHVFQIETLSGLVQAKVFVDIKTDIVKKVKVDMGKPRLHRNEIPMIGEKNDKVIAEQVMFQNNMFELTAVSMGNPHAVFYVDDIDEAPLTDFGPIIEKDKRFPDGINVEFIEVINQRELHFRVWERGSGITQACGTGACAAVVASILNGKMMKNQQIIVHLAGGDLEIIWADNDHVFMTGPAEVICKGEYFY
jgi:diaminopimelate epimerase